MFRRSFFSGVLFWFAGFLPSRAVSAEFRDAADLEAETPITVGAADDFKRVFRIRDDGTWHEIAWEEQIPGEVIVGVSLPSDGSPLHLECWQVGNLPCEDPGDGSNPIHTNWSMNLLPQIPGKPYPMDQGCDYRGPKPFAVEK